MRLKVNKPKKFKKGKIELWVNFTFGTIKFITDKDGNGQHASMFTTDPLWYKNSVHRDFLLMEKSDIFLGYL
jgi:hypothetical protein